MKISFQIIGFFFLLFSIQLTTAQAQEIDTSTVSIYEYGQPIDSCECNFENLFRNWTPQFVTNAGDIKLISYQFVEQLNDENIDPYIELLVCPNVLSAGIHAASKTESYSVEGDSIPRKRE